MKRGCTQCGDCLNECPVFQLFRREEYAPKAKRLLLEAFERGDSALTWQQAFHLSRLCAGCGRCKQQCARKLSTADLLADMRARHGHWTQFFWNIWIRRAGPLWPLAGRVASLYPMALSSQGLRASVETARVMARKADGPTWLRVTPREKVLDEVANRSVVLFAGCTASNVRPEWTAKARALLVRWGYTVLDASGFTCCGGTLHHAGQYAAMNEVRQQNISNWHSLGNPVVVTFCASCRHSLEEYAGVPDFMPACDAALWRHSVRSLSQLLVNADVRATPAAPAGGIGYHQPCHSLQGDYDEVFLRQGIPALLHGAGLCCGMGGVLKMTDPDLSARLGKACLEGLPGCQTVLTGCSGCVLQLASVANGAIRVRHWLDVVQAG